MLYNITICYSIRVDRTLTISKIVRRIRQVFCLPLLNPFKSRLIQPSTSTSHLRARISRFLASIRPPPSTVRTPSRDPNPVPLYTSNSQRSDSSLLFDSRTSSPVFCVVSPTNLQQKHRIEYQRICNAA